MPLDKYLRETDPFYKAYLDKERNDAGQNSSQLRRGNIKWRSSELYSSWLELITYKRTLNYGRYMAIIFFDPFVTMSPKNPNGFGPLIFKEVTLKDIQSLINADSPGREYLNNWAYGNKPIAYLDTLYEQREAVLRYNASQKQLLSINKSQSISEYREIKKEAEDILKENPFLAEAIREIDFDDINLDIEKFIKYREIVMNGQMDLYFLAKRVLLDIEDIFAININKRIGFTLLSGLSGKSFNANNWYQFKFYIKNLRNILAKNELGQRGGLKGIQKVFNRIIRNRNPLYSSRSRLIIYNNTFKMIKDHFKDKDVAKEFTSLNQQDINLKTKKWKSDRIKGREWTWRKSLKKVIRFIKFI